MFTHKARSRNKITITVKGKMLRFPSMKAAAKAFNINYHLLMKRLSDGWLIERALLTPKGNQGRRIKTNTKFTLDELLTKVETLGSDGVAIPDDDHRSRTIVGLPHSSRR